MVRRSVIAACAVASSLVLAIAALPARAAGGEVQIRKSDRIGAYLADGSGRTLYTFRKDTAGRSACAGDCVQKWPVFHAGDVSAPAGVDPSAFSTITRDDGKTQTTYRGMPLYYFGGDGAPGDTKGHGFRDVWDAARP